MYTTLDYDKRQSGRMTEVSCTADNSAGVMVDPTVPIRSDLDPDNPADHDWSHKRLELKHVDELGH